jgi:hypothetical protein
MEKNKIIASGISLPPLLWKGKVVSINFDTNQRIEPSQSSGLKVSQCPLTFKADGLDDFTFPIDPLISMGFRNIITRRTVAKGNKRGTIKERWTEDDVEISIVGIFINESGDYPEEVDKLRVFFERHSAIDVECSLINNRGIESIAIEALELPFTKGINNQAFAIKAYSDDVFNLLIEK